MIINSNKQHIRKEKLKNKRLVMAFGSFDVLHVGHLEYLSWAKSLADVLIVVLQNDEQIKLKKGQNRPYNNQNHRATIVDSIKAVDYVMVRPPGDWLNTALKIINDIQPDFLALGSDWGPAVQTEHQGVAPKAKTLICPLPFVGVSTTKLIKKINGNNEAG